MHHQGHEGHHQHHHDGEVVDQETDLKTQIAAHHPGVKRFIEGLGATNNDCKERITDNRNAAATPAMVTDVHSRDPAYARTDRPR